MKQSNVAWSAMLVVAAVSMSCRPGVTAEGASKNGFVLAQEGKSAAKIVIAQDPCPVIVAAAEELQLHVEKATGARLPVVKEGELKTPSQQDSTSLTGC